MKECLALRSDHIFVKHLANSLLLAAIFALILPLLSTIQFVQTYSEALSWSTIPVHRIFVFSYLIIAL